MTMTQPGHRTSGDVGAIQQHIESLDLYGYTVVRDALNPEQVHALREATEHLYETDPGVAAKRKAVPDMYHIENLANKGELFETFFLNPTVLPLVYHFLGDDFTMGDVCSFGVAPQGFTRGATFTGRFHSDDQVSIPGYPLSMVTFYPLVDLTKENGGTRMVPGSHKAGRHPEPGKTHYEGEIAIEAPAGSCLVFFGSLWHASGPNSTDQIRTTVVAAFARPWIKPYIDFTRSLRPDVLARATPEARRIFGIPSRTVHTERWQWDEEAGRPKQEYRDALKAQFGYGDCCL